MFGKLFIKWEFAGNCQLPDKLYLRSQMNLNDFPKDEVIQFVCIYIYIFLMFVHRYFFEECSYFDFFCCCCWKDLSFMVDNYGLKIHLIRINLSVCLIFILAKTSLKIGHWPGNFGMVLNYIGLL